MLATTLIRQLEQLVTKHGNWPIEIDAPFTGIYAATKVKFAETDSERGPTIVIESDGRAV